MNNQEIVAKLWNLCNVLRDDGITYHQYVTELTYILFLKMCKETGTETGNRAMVRCFLSCKQPHEIDISAAGSFDFSGRIDSLGIRIGQDLEYVSFF